MPIKSLRTNLQQLAVMSAAALLFASAITATIAPEFAVQNDSPRSFKAEDGGYRGLTSTIARSALSRKRVLPRFT